MPTFDDWSAQLRLADFDRLVDGVRRWVESSPPWPPFDRARAVWVRIAPSVEQLRVDLDRVLVVGVVGGTGTGKSTLLNALVGQRICQAGDIVRPTTRRPVVLTQPDLDMSFLRLDDCQPEVHRLTDVPLLSQMVLVDCPDPDTQSRQEEARPPTRCCHRPKRTAISIYSAAFCRTAMCSFALALLKNTKRTQFWMNCCEMPRAGRSCLCKRTRRSMPISPPIGSGIYNRTVSQCRTHFASIAKRPWTVCKHIGRRRRSFRLWSISCEPNWLSAAGIESCVPTALDLLSWFLTEAQREADAFVPALSKLEQAVAAERNRLLTQVKSKLHEQIGNHRGVVARPIACAK